MCLGRDSNSQGHYNHEFLRLARIPFRHPGYICILPENPENDKQEELGGEAIDGARNRVMEKMVEFVERLEKPRFIFEEVARSFEEIGQESKKCTPKWSEIHDCESRPLCPGNNSWVHSNYNYCCQNKIYYTVKYSHLSCFATIT